MSILADTNVLLRRTQPDHPSHASAVESIARLLAAGDPVYFTLQNMSEFWNVATRPASNNGLGFSAALAHSEIPNDPAGLTGGLWGMEAPGGAAQRSGKQGARHKVGGDNECPRYPQDSDVQYRGFHAPRHRSDSPFVVVILDAGFATAPSAVDGCFRGVLPWAAKQF